MGVCSYRAQDKVTLASVKQSECAAEYLLPEVLQLLISPL